MTTTILIFLNILLIELILSIDNASVLAVIVNKNLSDQKERDKALRYGILGAYIFRGLCLLLVSWIIYNPSVGAIFKIIGGLYLAYLWFDQNFGKDEYVSESDLSSDNAVTRFCRRIGINKFWTVVVMVEFLDIVFSLDNLVAVVSLSSNIWIVCGAVFIGILGMRFVAKYFSQILSKYPSLEDSAFVVILLLGIKMFMAGVMDFFPESSLHIVLNSHAMDLCFSALTLIVFMLPIIRMKLRLR